MGLRVKKLYILVATRIMSQTGFEDVAGLKWAKFAEYCLTREARLLDGPATLKYIDKTTKSLETKDIVKMVDTDDYTVEVKLSSKYMVNYVSKNDLNAFRSFNNFIKEYHSYRRTKYLFDGTEIRSFNDDNGTWFDLYQISTILGYAKRSYLATHYGPRYKLALQRNQESVYTNEEGLREILNRGRKPMCKEMLQQLDFDTSDKINSPEADILVQIIDFVKTAHDDIKYDLQYPCGTYRIDMYIPKYNVVIEVDELGHKDRDPIYEAKREDYIRSNLSDKILRVNPNAINFRMAKELGILNRMMKS